MPKGKKKKIRGQVFRIKENDEIIVIEILEKKSFDFVLKWYQTELYDIKFELNRLTYQLQHYVLHFIELENLFDVLINYKLYQKASKRNGVPQIDHCLK